MENIQSKLFCAFIWFKSIEKNGVSNEKWFFAT
jgi:hypothetical protein